MSGWLAIGLALAFTPGIVGVSCCVSGTDLPDPPPPARDAPWLDGDDWIEP